MFNILKSYEKTPQTIVQAYNALSESASINECLPNKDGALHSRIRPVWKGIRMCGTALTVECGIGDNLILHKAISMAQPGDVLMVINGMHDEAGGMFGEMMAASLKGRRAAGIVLECSCRDTIAIESMHFPVFSTGISIKPTSKVCPGRINHPIVIGGVYVRPGDLVFGDNDGVVVVPREISESILTQALAREEKEANMREHILNGELTTFKMFEESYNSLHLLEEL